MCIVHKIVIFLVFCVILFCIRINVYGVVWSCVHTFMTDMLPLGGLNLGPAAMLQQQGIFSPPTSAITHSPVQILGKT